MLLIAACSPLDLSAQDTWLMDKEEEKAVRKRYRNMSWAERAGQLLWLEVQGTVSGIEPIPPAGYVVAGNNMDESLLIASSIRTHYQGRSPLLSTTLHDMLGAPQFPDASSLPPNMDSTLLDPYLRYHRSLLGYLGCDMDFSSGQTLGFQLQPLEAADISDSEIAKALETHDGVIIRGNLSEWVDRIDHYAFLRFDDSLESRTFSDHLGRYVPIHEISHVDIPETAALLQRYDYVFVLLRPDEEKHLADLISALPNTKNLRITVLGGSLNARSDGVTYLWHNEYNQKTAALAPQIWFGGARINPTATPLRLGFSQPEIVGIASHTLEEVSHVVQQAIDSGAFPGCRVLVARAGKVVYDESFGTISYDLDTAVNEQTLYDLASISKVIGTGSALMSLFETGQVDLEQKLSKYMPKLAGTTKENLIIKDVMLHQSGMYSYWPFWRRTVDQRLLDPELYSRAPTTNDSYMVAPGIYPSLALRDSVFHWTLSTPMAKRDDPRAAYPYLYSDLGFYLLYELVESELKSPLDIYLTETFFRPLGMRRTTFAPTCIAPLAEIAPTEQDEYFRNQQIHGTVHDPTAAMFGGIAGHAGIFSTARDLSVFLQMLLWNGTYGGRQYFQPETIRYFASKHYTSNRRGLGWDKPDPDGYGNASRYASFDAFGHTGFTGTAVWVDPQFDLIYVFLSNRVFPDVENDKLSKQNVRSRIHDIIYEAIWDYEKTNAPHEMLLTQ